MQRLSRLKTRFKITGGSTFNLMCTFDLKSCAGWSSFARKDGPESEEDCLDGSKALFFLAARLIFIAADRADVQFATKGISPGMSEVGPM